MRVGGRWYVLQCDVLMCILKTIRVTEELYIQKIFFFLDTWADDLSGEPGKLCFSSPATLFKTINDHVFAIYIENTPLIPDKQKLFEQSAFER